MAADAGILATMEAIEGNARLFDAAHFEERARAIDELEARVVDRLRFLLADGDGTGELRALHRRATALQRRLEGAHEELFEQFRQRVRAGCTGRSLRQELQRYLEPPSERRIEFGPRYDTFDVLVSGLLSVGAPPTETRAREPEMVSYQPTPARLILELVDRASIDADDVLYDLGSGLGQVPILVALLTGARAVGIEREPAYCRYARRCARNVKAAQVQFVNADAREADLADGTVFYLYTPFQGTILRQVLARLQGVAQRRAIGVGTYGPCTHDVAEQPWLTRADSQRLTDHTLALFLSA